MLQRHTGAADVQLYSFQTLAPAGWRWVISLTPQGKGTDTHQIWGRMGPKADLDIFEDGKNLLPLPEI